MPHIQEKTHCLQLHSAKKECHSPDPQTIKMLS